VKMAFADACHVVALKSLFCLLLRKKIAFSFRGKNVENLLEDGKIETSSQRNTQ